MLSTDSLGGRFLGGAEVAVRERQPLLGGRDIAGHRSQCGSIKFVVQLSQPLFCRGEEIETIHAEGFPLGMFPNASWEEFSISTQPGDSVIFFSDGIVDAQNAAGEMFGNDRLVAVVKKHQHKSASKLAESILSEVGRFQGKRERFDDETVVVLRVL